MRERGSLKAYLSNVHGQLGSSDECCSHCCLVLTLSYLFGHYFLMALSLSLFK